MLVPSFYASDRALRFSGVVMIGQHASRDPFVLRPSDSNVNRRSPIRRALVATLVLAAVSAGCTRYRQRARAAKALAAQRAIPLATTARKLDPPAPCGRMLVAPGGIAFDDAAWFAAKDHYKQERLVDRTDGGALLPVVHERLVSLDGWKLPEVPGVEPGWSIPEIATALDLEFERSWDDDACRGAVNIYFHRETPYSLVRRVLQTVNLHSAVRVVVTGPAGDGVLRPDVFAGQGETSCVVPVVQIGAAGASVRMGDSTFDGLFCFGGDGTGKPVRCGPDKMIVSRVGACPSVPRRNGQLDGPALTALLEQVKARLPPCPFEPESPDERDAEAEMSRRNDILGALFRAEHRHNATQMVFVGGGPDVRWQEIVAGADAAAAAGLDLWRASIAAEPPESCDGASVPVDDIRLRDLPRHSR
jgi:hypothetical protein